MNKFTKLLNWQSIIVFTLIAAAFIIVLSLADFGIQVNASIQQEMRHQVEAIQETSTKLLKNEMAYLKGWTETAAEFLNRTSLETDEDIVAALKSYADASGISRMLFVTLDERAYTSYSGYLGQSDANKLLDGIPLSDITETTYSQARYADELGKAVFGVVTPVTLNHRPGVLISSYDIERLKEIFRNQFLEGEAHVGIVDSRGKVILGEQLDFTPTAFGFDIFDAFEREKAVFSYHSREKMRQDFANGEAGSVIYSCNDINRYCSYAPLGIGDWYVSVMARQDVLKTQSDFIKRVGNQLAAKLIIIMTLLLIVSIVVLYNEQRRIREKLQKVATTDSLTGILNRGAVEAAITKFLSGEGSHRAHALFIMDVDFFKGINDNFGHVVGDMVLKEFAVRLQTILGERGVIGRVGGDEFIALLKDYANLDSVLAMAGEIVTAFHNNFSVDSKIIPTSISIGVALSDKNGRSFMELYQKADDALYETKQRGKNGFTLSSAGNTAP